MALEAHLCGDNTQDQNTSFSDKGNRQRSEKVACEDSTAFLSQEKGIKRKRGRPVGSGIKNVKPAAKQTRRTRPQNVRKPAKICEYESPDESESRDKRPFESLDFYEKHSEPQENEEQKNVEVAGTVESSELNKVDNKLKDLKDNDHEIEMTDRYNDHNNEVVEKLDFSADPLQAMLFDMIPSLGTQKVEQPVNPSVREEKVAETSNAETVPTTTKKNKVSFLDAANELLKDW